MEGIINFLEQYWGYTIVGGVSFGSIITFTIAQIKSLIKDKNKSQQLTTAIDKADSLCEEINRREEAHKIERAQLENKISEQNQEIQAQTKYTSEVMATIFQAVSYLVIASKLPTEDKIALQEKFTALANTKLHEYKETVKDEVVALKSEVEQKIIPDATATVAQAVEETKSLLDKYSKEG